MRTVIEIFRPLITITYSYLKYLFKLLKCIVLKTTEFTVVIVINLKLFIVIEII